MMLDVIADSVGLGGEGVLLPTGCVVAVSGLAG
jgi:hypothetical protein